MSPSEQPHLCEEKPEKQEAVLLWWRVSYVKGFMLCSHVIAAAHNNGDLRSFLEYLIQSKCGPNLTAITNCGKPSGSGRKSGDPKLKMTHKAVPVETQSVRQCLEKVALQSLHLPLPFQFLRKKRLALVLWVLTLRALLLQSFALTLLLLLLTLLLWTLFLSTVHLQTLILWTLLLWNQLLWLILHTSSIRCGSGLATDQFNSNPFILKFKIKDCQSCWQNCEGVTDTMGLVLAHVERRMVSNLALANSF